MRSRRGTGVFLATRHTLLAMLAAVVGLVMVGVEMRAAVAAPEVPDDDAPWVVKKEPSVPGKTAKPKPRKPDPAEAAAITTTPRVRWPGKDTVELAVSASGETATVTTLPIRVAAGKSRAETPSRIRVESLGRKGARLLLRVSRDDGAQRRGSVRLTVDYSGFRHAYGGDWATRLRLVQYGDCTPGEKGCLGTPLPTHNDGSGALSAEVAVTPDATVYAVEAAAASGAGSFTASSLRLTATWTAGGASGDFGWSYPMEVPPSLGGPAPELSLHYSSGSVDGLTSATNNQPSWVGEGFDLAAGGYIERRYASCGTDTGGNNGDRKTGDLCWRTDNATFSIGGKGGELVRDDATGAWRPRNDDGSTVERLTGAPNGDNDGEYWRITAPDGTQYYFGLHRLPGWQAGNAETNSVWTVPVYGNHAGEPCHQSGFADSWCLQAYRWNLDYVVDRNGNTMSLFYDVETNNYARNLTPTAVSTYVRAGHLKRIEYGQLHGEVYTSLPVARVLFTTAERCIPGSACDPSKPETYPDTPLDLACTSSTDCGNKNMPTFWTTKRLAKVTTQVRRGTEFTDVSSWTLRHTFPDPGDGTRAGLWLEGITQAGHVGGTTQLPEINFDGVQLPNRVDGIDGIPPMNWWRISAVHYGTGGELAVKYSQPECTATNLPPVDNNTKRCHPRKWTPEGMAERTDWFHKYVVVEVTESDRVSGLEPVVTQIDYLSPPAWRFEDADGLVDISQKTWAVWRGYELVRVRKGHPSGTQTTEVTRYFRGMDGDRTASGGTKSVSIVDSTGAAVPDSDAFAGQVRERLSYDGEQLVNRVISDYWMSPATATRVREWGTTRAHQIEDAAARQTQAVTGGYRYTSSRNIYSATGALIASEDLRDESDPSDDTCTRFEYSSNASAGLIEVPVRSFTVPMACDKPWDVKDIVADERVYYDGNTSYTAPPTKGNLTKAERLAEITEDGQLVYQTVFTASYDVHGRAVRVTDALGNTSTMEYVPATGGPVTKTIKREPLDHITTTELEPAWGEELAVTDPAGRRTEARYDPLGRTTKVWLPGRSPEQDSPNFEYSYLVRDDGPNAVITKTLSANGETRTTYELYDGLQRLRQTQQPAPGGGRVVYDWVYDSRNLQVKENGPYYNDAPPGTDVLLPEETMLPAQKVVTYDARELPTAEIFTSFGTEKWRITHYTTGDAHVLDPPRGEQATMRITDPEGRLRELRQYHGDTPSGSYDVTRYTYTPLGQLESVTDPAGNVWRFSYDLRGRKVREEDPDKGTTIYTYDDLDRLTSSTDSRGVTLAYAYDELNRRTAVHLGSLTGPKLAEWVYDTLAKGQITSATRYVDGHRYTTAITGYDAGGRPTGVQVSIPEVEGALAGTYLISRTYGPDGQERTKTLPAVGDLPKETLTFGYNEHDLPTTLTGDVRYVANTEYTPYGEPTVITMYPEGGKWLEYKYEYELGTRRLARVVTDRELSPRRVSNVTYEYDPAGNITKITDSSNMPGVETDTQCFRYDHLRRLTAAWTPASGDCAAAPTAEGLGGPAPYWHEWTFDLTGNRTSEKRVDASGAVTTSTYSYAAPGGRQPHALRAVTTTGPDGTSSTVSYDYDQTGNLTTRTRDGVTETFTWDAEGHLESVSRDGETTSFVYDADGNRLIRRDSSGTTLYMEDTEVLLKPNGEVVGTRYYRHGGQLVAMRGGGKLFWVGADHHGTVNTLVDAETQEVYRERTDPYGQVRGKAPATWPTQRGFVGGTKDPSTGLVHLGAREYDPTTGRFISVDPIADVEDPQQLNGYAYANNNPISFVDPDGRAAWVPIVILIVRLIPVIVRVVKQLPTIIRTVVPVVVRVVNWVKSFLSWLWEAVTTFVTRMVTVVRVVIKTVVETVTQVIKKIDQVIKKIPIKRPKAEPTQVAKAKPKAAQQARNTSKPQKKPAPKDQRSQGAKKPETQRDASKSIKEASNEIREAAKKEGQGPKGTGGKKRREVKYGHARQYDFFDNPYRDPNVDFTKLPDRKDPWKLDAYKGDPVGNVETFAGKDGKLDPEDLMHPTSRFGKFGLIVRAVTTGLKWYFHG